MRDSSGISPFTVVSKPPIEGGVFGDKATRTEGGFLYRVIEISQPVEFEFVYSAWWFRQTIDVEGLRVWRQISWLWIKDRAEFLLPAAIDPQQRTVAMKIDFSRGLRIRRFRIWIADHLIYDEWTD